MQNKLQELTDKLYLEGLSRGKEEGEALLAQANAKAADIIAAAEAKAGEIVAKAEKEADDYRLKITSDLKMASVQSVQATKKDIENLLVFKMAGDATDKVLSDIDFVKEVIRSIASRFSSEQSSDLDIVLPEKLKSELEPFIANELSSILGLKVSASFSKKISGGFTIGPSDGSYFISFTDETFKELISEYLRPAARKLLFGE